MKNLILVFLFVLCTILISANSLAQDAAEVDPEHYKVEFENDQVRVLRINYSPGDKSVMHSHPEGVVIFLTDGSGRFTYPDGKTEDMNFESGLVIWTEAQTHQSENNGDKPFEVIQIEMKKSE
jgi:quercetin dioxygenase-like cupin family protein